NDYYNFSLDADSNFTLNLDTMTADANVRVLDSKGQTVLSSFNTGSSPEKIVDVLAAGDYKVHVFAAGTAKTNYFLSMGAEATTDPVDPVDPVDPEDPITGSDPNGTLETATDLGQLGDLITQPDTKIGFTENGVRDLNDYYKLGVSADSDVTIVLDKLAANVDLQLLDSSGTLLVSSTQTGNTAETILETLSAGDYYLQVSPVGTAQTSYSLSIF
ncbi:MAG: PPC domain-containing protein, partial [Planktothrix sp.]|uniref:PPC domain-containing protein n=1 Tax=Planktothrix sp. TaxID=3088171 RepID=UPI0038D4B8D6